VFTQGVMQTAQFQASGGGQGGQDVLAVVFQYYRFDQLVARDVGGFGAAVGGGGGVVVDNLVGDALAVQVGFEGLGETHGGPPWGVCPRCVLMHWGFDPVSGGFRRR